MEADTPLTEGRFVADMRRLLACERKEERRDGSVLERRLIRAELVLLILAVISIAVMQWLRVGQGLPETGTLMPNFGLAVLRMRVRA